MKKLLTGLMIIGSIFAFGCESKDQEQPIVEDLPPTTNTAQMKLSPEKGDTIATIKTNKGEIKVLLYTDMVPLTTENFIELANQGKYTDVPFHRVIKGFMIQGGDFQNKNGTGGYSFKGPGTLLKNEFIEGLDHRRGALSMARTAAPDSAGSQFFIVHEDSHFLDGQYAVFGYAYEGMDVVDTIAEMPTDGMDQPLDDAMIESVEISKF